MKDTSKTKSHHQEEISALRARIAELEAGNRVDRPSGKSRVEDAIQETEAQFWGALEDGVVPLAIFNSDLQFVKINRAFCDLLGYAKQEIEGRIIKDLIHPDDVEPFIEVMTRIFKGDLPSCELENRYLTKAGTTLWCTVSATVVRDREGTPTCISIAIENITERKQVEIVLGETKREYEQLVNSVKGIVWEADFQTFQFTWVSQEAERLLGYPLQRWTAEPTFWQDHIHPEDRDRATEYCVQQSVQHDHYEFEYRMIAATGDVVWLRDLVAVVPGDGEAAKLQGVMVDITELKQAQNLQAEQQSLLEGIALSTPLSEVLTSLCQMIEAQSDGLMCSILLLEGDRLRYGAAPSLPDSFSQKIDGMIIGPTVGSCGTAAFLKEPVVVSDIASDPLWEKARHFALRHGLQACWSTPILSSEGSVLGTFALYYTQSRYPNSKEQELVKVSTSLAGIAIERKRSEEVVQARAHQQALVSELGQLALTGLDLPTLMDKAVTCIAQTLKVEYCKVLELLPGAEEMILRAGFGCPTEAMNQLTVGAGMDSQAGYTLVSDEPVVVEDLRTEIRFNGPQLLHQLGIISGMSVIVSGKPQHYGVLGVHSTQLLKFTRDDIHFVQSVANTLALAIERKRTEEVLEAQQRFLRQVIDINPNFVFAKDREGRFTLVNEAVADIYGTTVENLLGKTDEDFNPNVEEVEFFRQMDLEVMDSQQERFIAEEVISDAIGKLHYLQTVKRPLVGADGVANHVLGVAADITERKKVEETLRAIVEGTAAVTSSDFFRSLLRHLAVAFNVPYAFISECVDTTNTRVRTVVFLNKGTFVENVEYALEGTPCEEVIGGKICYHPRDVQRLFPRDADLVALGVQCYLGFPLYDSSNKVIGHLVIMDEHPVLFDARTESLLKIFAARAGAELERKQSEEALRKSEEHLRFVTDNSPVCIAHCDQEQRYKFVNRHYAEMLGLQAHDIVGKFPREILGEAAYGHARFYIEAVLAGQHPEYDNVLPVTPNGQRTVRVSYAPERDASGQVIGFLASIVDITERKESEILLKASEERYAMAMGAVDDGIWDWETATEHVYFSPTWKKQLGYKDHEVQNVFEEWVSRIHREDYDRVMASLKNHFDWNHPYELEYRLWHKDGSYVWVLARGACIRNEQGRPIRMIGSHSDVTQRREAEEKVRQTELQLRHSQKMNAIGTLAGGIAHDFNNILAAIMGYTELAINKSIQEESVKRYLTEVQVAGSRAKELVKQILTFSRLAEGQKKPLHLQQVVQEVLMLIRATLPATIEINLQVTASFDLVEADSTQMHQVIMNLCTNAEYAMRDQGGVLTVKLETLEEIVDVDLMHHEELTPGPRLLLTVKDTGHGMSPDVLDRIFDPFFTTKNPGEGSGMGLAVAHGIIADHHGSITVKSRLGEGTAVSIVLPLLPVEVADTDVDEELHLTIPYKPGQGRVLFVDDEATLVVLGKELLEEFGYEVTTITSSLDALKAFRAAPDQYDILITDQTMPNLSGEALAREIFQIRPDLPILLCTGFSHTMTEEKARNLGIRKFLMKPLFRHDLLLAVQEVMAEGKNRDRHGA